MHRDIRELLRRWGTWARSEERCSCVDWPSISPVIALVTPRRSAAPSLSDDDGIIVDSCIANLGRTGKRDELMALSMYYIAGCSTRVIARELSMSQTTVARMLERAENFVEGSLSWLGNQLDFNIYSVISPRPEGLGDITE